MLSLLARNVFPPDDSALNKEILAVEVVTAEVVPDAVDVVVVEIGGVFTDTGVPVISFLTLNCRKTAKTPIATIKIIKENMRIL